jgi:hypothetical protein
MSDRLSNDYADQIARLKQERDAQAQRIAELEAEVLSLRGGWMDWDLDAAAGTDMHEGTKC